MVSVWDSKKSQIEGAKYSVIWANEIDKEASVTYRSNFKHPLLEGDINLVLDPNNESNQKEEADYYRTLKNQMFSTEIDILNGGFPCQSFSIAGEQKGFEDERGNLFWSIINTVKIHEEKIWS